MPQEELNIVMKASDILKKGDFEKYFKQVLQLVLDMQRRQQKAITDLEKTYAQLLAKMQSDSDYRHNELKGQTNQLFVGERLNEMSKHNEMSMSEMKKMMSEMIDKKLKEVDGRMMKLDAGEKTMRGNLDGHAKLFGMQVEQKLKEVDKYKIDKAEVIEELKKEFQKIKDVLANIPRGRAMGRAKVPMPRMVDLTSQQNGSARTFNVPPDTVRIFGAFSSQFPYAIALSDISKAGNQITLGDTVAPRETGQTLILLTDALFYP